MFVQEADKLYFVDENGIRNEVNIPLIPYDDKTATFPSEGFDSNPNCKPKIYHSKTKLSDSELYNHVYEHWRKDSLSVGIVCDFAIRTLKGIQEKTDDTWQSFGVTIATPGSTISPMDLLQIEETERESDSLSSDLPSAPPEEVMGMLALIMSVYGLNEPNSTPRREVKYPNSRRDIYSLFESYPFYTSKKLADAPKLYKHWNMYNTFRAIIAATDMFFSKFNESKFSSLRAVTQLSRWKGCSAMGYMDLLSEILSLPKSECERFIFFDNIKDELRKMKREGQEIDKQDSYSPYLLELGLCQRSPYSASQNRLLHNYVHCIGSMFGVRRCQNAKLLTGDGFNPFAYPYAKFAMHIAYFRQKSLNPNEGGLEDPQNIPQKTLCELYCACIQAKVPEEVRKWFDETTSKWRDISEGSCAKHVVKTAFINSY